MNNKVKRKCPLCGEEKILTQGITGIGLVCSDCGFKHLEEYKKTLESLL